MRLPKVWTYLLLSLFTIVAVFGVLARAQEGGGPAKGRDLLYVTAQGTAYLPPYALGLGVLVYDVNDNFRFVKRFATFDYAASVDELVARGAGWLRTYSRHGRGGHPLEHVGEQDITADVMVEQLLHSAAAAGLRLVAQHSQAEWLDSLGIGELVEDGRRAWDAGAARGDLDALAGRSIVSEAAALTDPTGLGAHRVFTFRR